LRPYETMLLIDARRQDAEIEAAVERFTTLVTEGGGEVTNLERWGRRRLAYVLGDNTDGYYAIFTYNVDPSKRAEIEAALPFVEGLVRAKTVRRDIRTRGV
jgi:small subunit ribosomal protein S6